MPIQNRISALSTAPSHALSAAIAAAIECVQAGDAGGVGRLLNAVADEARQNAMACRAFALLHASVHDHLTAIEWFDRTLELSGKSPELLAGKGAALQSVGRPADAVTCFNLALSSRANDPETWYNRGIALEDLNDIDDALTSYKIALQQRPDYTRAAQRHCAALAKLGQLDAALAEAEALTAIPTASTTEAWCLRGNILHQLGRYSDALASYERALSLRPNDPPALINRALTLNVVGHHQEALTDLDAALQIAPDQPEALIAKANALQSLQRHAEAEAAYRSAYRAQPLITHPAIAPTPDFRALFLFAPSAGNTPIDDMISFSNFESNTLMLFSDVAYDVEFLRSRTDVVVNLVSEVDCSKEALAQALSLTSALKKPLINSPAKLLLMDREQVSRLLTTSIPACRVPLTRRHSRQSLLAAMADKTFDLPFAFIARVAGRHGGEDMELVGDAQELATFVQASDASAFYITEYIDYRSEDGLFRKYRFIFVGDEILPYHLAIGDLWKVHHATTGMENRPDLQAEEERFLTNPQSVFDANAFAALRAIRNRIDLDYFGIDCALDSHGQIVVFEVNASMLVHLHNDAFPYKNGPVGKIKSAFAKLLQDRAALGQAQTA